MQLGFFNALCNAAASHNEPHNRVTLKLRVFIIHTQTMYVRTYVCMRFSEARYAVASSLVTSLGAHTWVHIVTGNLTSY